MPYPAPRAEDIAFYREHGWLVVRDAIPQDEIDLIEQRCQVLVDKKEKFAFDWAWDAKESREERSFKIVQSSPTLVWEDVGESQHRKWLVGYASALMDMDMEVFFNMFLGKPPGKSAPTYWHQDEAYWGRNLEDRGITCWIPLHDVDISNGCMHFIDRGHREGIHTHRLVDGVQSDLLTCAVDEGRVVSCPVKRGDVTFHHSKTPHMTPANVSKNWRKIVTNHLQKIGSGGEGGHYPWKVYVNQRTGERIIPERS
jgi:hypothetical protein